MSRSKSLRLGLLASALLAVLPATLWAQTGAIAGVVKDSTGGVLPGVTVEAASPALIEKIRTAVSDKEGQYKIVDLRPGTYVVTFTLGGFNTVKREGIELSAGFTANVNADLRVGDVAETITVSGMSPIVDVQNVVQHNVLTRDVIDQLPTGKTMVNFAVLIPGVVVAGVGNGISGQDVGGAVGENSVYLSVHGSRGLEMPLLYDGMRYNNMNGYGGGFNTNYAINSGASQEITVDTGSLSAESLVSGLRANVIPKDGGNTFKGFFATNFTNHNLVATNVTPELAAFGISPVPGINKIWDFNPAGGGPIMRDKLWFYGAFRYWGNYNQPAGAFYNKDPLAWAFVQDPTRPALDETWNRSTALRLTWQASSRNKFSLFGDNQDRCSCHIGVASNRPPEAAIYQTVVPNYLVQTGWSSPVTNRLLFDVGATVYTEAFITNPPRDPAVSPSVVSVTEQSTGAIYRNVATLSINRNVQFSTKAYMSYVTGSHAFKVGMQTQSGHRRITNTGTGNDTSYQFNRGVPVAIVQQTTPYSYEDHVKLELGLFAQDQWTINRVTLNAGVRFDYLNSYVPSQFLTPVRFVGVRDFAAVPDVPNWKDIVPRLGMSYDVFGNGKTAIKVAVGKYVQSVTTLIAAANNPVITSVNSATRSWADLNGNFIPDCDLTNLAANGNGDLCGPIGNANFGKTNITTKYDADALNGWGKRRYDWETQAGIQQEVRPGLALSGTFTRHWYGNFLVTDNLAADPSDYTSYCVPVPVDPRLPGGGGNQLCGFKDVNPNRFGQVNNLVTFSKNFGDQSEVYTGVDLAMNLRFRHGVLLQGGSSTGHTVLDNCELVGKVDNPAASNSSGILASPSALYCHNAPPVQTQIKLLGILPLPWWGLMASATYQSVPGPQITASYAVTNAQVAPTLGRLLSGGTTTATVQLVAPGTLYEDRLNQVDFRITKNIKLGSARASVQFDLYNLLNASPVLALNTTYGPVWQQPRAVLAGRMAKFGAQFNF